MAALMFFFFFATAGSAQGYKWQFELSKDEKKSLTRFEKIALEYDLLGDTIAVLNAQIDSLRAVGAEMETGTPEWREVIKALTAEIAAYRPVLQKIRKKYLRNHPRAKRKRGSRVRGDGRGPGCRAAHKRVKRARKERKIKM